MQDNDSWRRSEQYGIQVLHMSKIVFKFFFWGNVKILFAEICPFSREGYEILVLVTSWWSVFGIKFRFFAAKFIS